MTHKISVELDADGMQLRLVDELRARWTDAGQRAISLSASNGERAGVRCRIPSQQATFFNCYAPEAREILNDLLEKYASDGELQFTLPDVLKVPPISQHGNVNEIIGKFGGADQLRNVVNPTWRIRHATERLDSQNELSPSAQRQTSVPHRGMLVQTT